MPSKQSLSKLTTPDLFAQTLDRLRALRALYVKSASLGPGGELEGAEFFSPAEVLAAQSHQQIEQHLASTKGAPSGVQDISGLPADLLRLRAQLAACEKDGERAELTEKLREAESSLMTYWSSD